MTGLVHVDRSPVRASGVDALRAAIHAADVQRTELAEDGDYETLVHGLAQLLPLRRDLSDLLRAVEDDIARLMPSKTVEVEGVGVVERRKGTDRKKWDWDSLLPLLIRLWVDPDGTGEMPAAPEVVERMKALITDVVGTTPSKGPKVTPLRAAGVDPDEYCESSPGRVSVQIHGGER